MGAEIVSSETGELRLTTANGDEYGLLFDLRAIERLETQFGCSITDLFTSWDSKRPGVADLKTFVLTGNEGWHRRANGQGEGHRRVTPNNVLDVIESSGKFTVVFQAVIESVKLAWDEAHDDDDDEADDDVGDDAGPPGRGPTR